MEPISAERIFYKILHDCKSDTFTADPMALHNAFYDLYLKNSDKMQAFEFIIRINPYSPKLEELIFYYQLCGILTRENPDLVQYGIKKERLKEIADGDTNSFELEMPESFTAIFGENCLP